MLWGLAQGMKVARGIGELLWGEMLPGEVNLLNVALLLWGVALGMQIFSGSLLWGVALGRNVALGSCSGEAMLHYIFALGSCSRVVNENENA